MTGSPVSPLPELEQSTRANRERARTTEPAPASDGTQPVGAPPGSPEVTRSDHESGAPAAPTTAGTRVNSTTHIPPAPARRVESLWERVPGGVFILLATAAALVAFFAVGELPIPFVNEWFGLTLPQRGWLALAVLLIVVTVILLQTGTKRLARGASPTRGSFSTSLLSSALLDLGVGATVMVVIVVLKGTDNAWNVVAVTAGVVTAVLTAAIYATVQRERTWANRVNPWQFGQLAAHWAALDAGCAQLCPAGGKPQPDVAARCNEAIAHLAYVAETLGLDRVATPNGLGGPASSVSS